VCACVCVVLGQVGAFSVLKELVIVLPDSLSDHVGSLVPGIERALNVSAGHSMDLSSWLTWETIWQYVYIVFPYQCAA
jgi:hypothetical protein